VIPWRSERGTFTQKPNAQVEERESKNLCFHNRKEATDESAKHIGYKSNTIWVEPRTSRLQGGSKWTWGGWGVVEGEWGENSGVTKRYGWAEGNNSFSTGDSLKSEKKRECEGKKKQRCPPPTHTLSFLSSLLLKSPHFTPFLWRCIYLPYISSYHSQNFHPLSLSLPPHPLFTSSLLSLSPLFFSPRGSVKCQRIVLGDTADKNGVW